MYLQGDLQTIFDALYEMGIIEPLLEKDWKEPMQQMLQNSDGLFAIMDVVNSFQGDVKELIHRLRNFEDKTIQYLAMEVAREFADFHGRGEVH